MKNKMKIKVDTNLYSKVRESVKSDNDLKKKIKKLTRNKKLIIMYEFILISLTVFWTWAFITMLIKKSIFGGIIDYIILSLVIINIPLIFLIKLTSRSSYKECSSINKVIYNANILKDIYNYYYSTNDKFKELKNVSLVYLNSNLTLVEKNGNIMEYLQTKNDNEIYYKDINFLKFEYKNKESFFYIDNPLTFNFTDNEELFFIDFYEIFFIIVIIWALKPILKRTLFKLSLDRLVIKDEEFSEKYRGVKVSKKGNLKGKYKNESIEFNEKYTTNANTLDLKMAKFLDVKRVDALSKLNNKNFYKMWVQNDLSVEKIFQRQEIHPIGLFNFSNITSKKKFAKLICLKIQLESELLLNSLEYTAL
ncbi:hypothetical protein [Spiroplasma floricola]|uniref:DUF3137 domain-containing protein n=1 Tax=Spiroplasma floricola 23-6 TaxID=1336749 RepID=A0A2K8SEK7_9MOLU|nr:hypothetical protein [Spiroplasma floricola]AUB31886.1 hypothetical protein SFLOR_v1c08380 [Spiroplasma floricola 23-6]